MSARSAQQIWETALGSLQIEVNRSNFLTWLSGTTGINYNKDEFTVGVPNAFVAEFLEKNLRALIEKVLAGIIKRPTRVKFCVGTSEEKGRARELDLPLFNPRYTFDSFVVGKSNQLAHAAALKIVEEPGHVYNPLFIHGTSGLGKTHLLHAIGHASTDKGLNVLYASAEQFTNELVSAIRDGRTEEFRKKYRSADMLLIDDVQFFGGKEQSKENFFHTFNILHSSNRQIAVTSDCPPRDIPRLRERLRSRFEWGLVTDLQPPDFETRLAILQARAKGDMANITPDVFEYIALQIKENIRALEGALNRVVAYSKLFKGQLTPDMAARALENIASKESRPVPPTPALIAETVATWFQVTISDLKGRQRDEATILARHVSMYLMRQETDCSLSEIGKEMGDRSPATISHAFEKIADNIKNDPQLRRQVFNIQQKLHTTPEL